MSACENRLTRERQDAVGREICGKASWFQITRDIGMLLLNYCKFVVFSIKLGMNTNSTLGGFFYHLFTVFYASLFFTLSFELARKNIPVFENDSQRLLKIIFQSLVNLWRHVYARKYKPSQIKKQLW